MVISDVGLNDIVEMKRPHPCGGGSKRFKVIRLGADVKIQCLDCGKVLMLARDQFNKRLKKIVSKDPSSAD